MDVTRSLNGMACATRYIGDAAKIIEEEQEAPRERCDTT